MFGLSTTATIIVIAIFVLLIAGLIIFLCIRSRKKRIKRENDLKQREMNLVDALTNPMGKPKSAELKTIIPVKRIQITRCDASEQSGFTYVLGERIRIGRSDEYNNIVINEKTVSGRHCEIYARDGDFWVTDMQSSNQTVVFRRGEYIVVDSRVGLELKNNDRLRLGNVELLISFV